MASTYDDITRELSRHGLALRGGFVPEARDDVPMYDRDTVSVTVLVVGNAGRAMWPAFASAGVTGPHPLDRWTRAVVEPVASAAGARAVYPFEAPPLPFQRWAVRAWPVFRSPMGLLIDAEYGPWHALRAALLFPTRIDLPSLPAHLSPCERCVAKPCLTTCPVGAFTGAGFDYRGCRAYLATDAGGACVEHGCKARAACPVGTEHRYSDEQLRFHMRAFTR